jgi:hypothetical protein
MRYRLLQKCQITRHWCRKGRRMRQGGGGRESGGVMRIVSQQGGGQEGVTEVNIGRIWAQRSRFSLAFLVQKYLLTGTKVQILTPEGAGSLADARVV